MQMIPKHLLHKYIKQWLEEDIPGFDLAGEVIDSVTSMQIIVKEKCLLAGVKVVQEIFNQEDGNTINVEILQGDGCMIESIPQPIMTIKGPAVDLLCRERIALNVLARMSGIATQAYSLQQMVKSSSVNFYGRLAGTRKTTPGFRLFEREALRIAGIDEHRQDLSSLVMLKDNHTDIWKLAHRANSSLEDLIKMVKQKISFTQKLEVECRCEEEAFLAAKHGADIVMLDNFSPESVKIVSTRLRENFPNVLIEVSGGINSKNIQDYALPTVDVISMGCLTQGYSIIDFSMKIYHHP